MIEKVLLVGLTGPSGAGKSEVARQFVNEHVPVIDADVLARKVVEPGSECLKKLVEAFSEDILKDDGSLNRRQLARRAFNTAEDTKLLNDITHPYIIALTKDILMQMEQTREPIAVLDAPLLYESGMDKICDYTVSVIAASEIRLKRIMNRDSLTETEAKKRMAAQQDNDFYRKGASRVLENNGDLEQLRSQACALAKELRKWANEK